MKEFSESWENDKKNGNVNHINKLLDKVNKFGVESLDKGELNFWDGHRNINEYLHNSTDVGTFFLLKLKELGIIEKCSDAKVFQHDIWIFEMNGGFDYNKNHCGFVQIMIEDNHEISNSSFSDFIETNSKDAEDFETRYKLFICFSDNWEECIEALEIRENIAKFLDEKLRDSGLGYEINTEFDPWN